MLAACSIAMIFCGCSTSDTADGSAEDCAPDVVSVDETAPPDVWEPDLSPSPQGKPALSGLYSPFVELPEGAAVHLKLSGGNAGNQVSFNVYAGGLGTVAGIAFYVEYDAKMMEFKEAVPTANLGSGVGISTKTVVKMLEPGLLTFGAARFCETKIPWGSYDQCGGKVVDEPAPLVALYFKLKTKGESPLRFPDRHRLIRRPDHSLVNASWIGGAFRVTPDKEVTP